VSDYGRRKVRFLDVMRQTFDTMVEYPIAFILNVFGLHEFPLLDDDPLDSKDGAPREEIEDVEAFLAVLSSFSELNDKNVFVIGISPQNPGCQCVPDPSRFELRPLVHTRQASE
jgi:hypothetical protein